MSGDELSPDSEFSQVMSDLVEPWVQYLSQSESEWFEARSTGAADVIEAGATLMRFTRSQTTLQSSLRRKLKRASERAAVSSSTRAPCASIIEHPSYYHFHGVPGERPPRTMVPDEAIAKRVQKRRNAIAEMKLRRAYRNWLAVKDQEPPAAGLPRPVTPDPEEDLPKRDFEKIFVKWKFDVIAYADDEADSDVHEDGDD